MTNTFSKATGSMSQAYQQHQETRRISDRSDFGFIQHFFEEFYEKLIVHFNSIKSDFSTIRSAEDGIPGESDENIVRRTREILNDLYELLERQAFLAAQKGGEFGVSYYREGQYIMAALADELFLNFQWSGKFYWMENLLEMRLFGTYDAGDLFFKNLNDFLEKRDPLRKDVAEVYLLALGLGFKGKYRGMPDERQLDHYRHELYVFINHAEPRLYQGEDRLFPEAYSYTLDEGKSKKFQDMRFWTSTFVFIISVLLLISFLIWNDRTSDLDLISDDILKNKFLDM